MIKRIFLKLQIWYYSKKHSAQLAAYERFVALTRVSEYPGLVEQESKQLKTDLANISYEIVKRKYELEKLNND